MNKHKRKRRTAEKRGEIEKQIPCPLEENSFMTRQTIIDREKFRQVPQKQ